MKAVVIRQYGDVDALEWREVPDPVPGPSDLLVRVRASALNRADILQRRGQYPAPGPRAPFEIPGLEFAGEVVGAGSEVRGLSAGDRVMGISPAGAHAELLAIPAALAMRIPAKMNWEEAAALPEVCITSHDALLTQAGLQAGESVLIHAAGSGVGVAAVQIASLAGAGPIIGTAGSQEKLSRARTLGLDVGIDYREKDFAQGVAEATGGRGVDVLLDVVGAKYWEGNIRALAVRGRIVLVGLLGGASVQVNLGSLLSKRLTVRGTVLRSRAVAEKAEATRAFERWGKDFLESGRLRPVIDSVFPMQSIQEAHRRMESNANFGKIVLVNG